MKLTISLLITILICFKSFCQRNDSLSRLYVNETIYRYGNDFMKGTSKLKFNDLSKEFSVSPVGYDSYLIAKRQRKTSQVFRVISFLSSVAVVSFLADNRKNPTYIAFGIQIFSGIAGVRYHNLSNQQLDKAIWQRNKDLLFSN
jgi:hypothetical protein